MAEITREEFEKVYRQQLEPILKDLEVERLENNKKAGLCFIWFALGLLIGLFMLNSPMFKDIADVGVLVIIVSFVISVISASCIKKAERAKLKKLVVQKILTLYGNLYFSDKKESISYKEIKDMGLYPRSTSKATDDVIIGVDKGCNFIIAETKLTHTESRGSGDNRRTETITDFSGLIVKIQMKKNFTGKTIVGMKGDIRKMSGFEKVELESVDFMRNREIYSTDQIESRYILTTVFMERLQNLGINFIKGNLYADADVHGGDKAQMDKAIHAVENIGSNVPTMVSGFVNRFIEREITGVSAGFVGGYVYLFIPTYENFFEINIGRGTLLQPHIYYNIYKELEAILKVIEYLHLDKNTGL